jgi:hypothetical protein
MPGHAYDESMIRQHSSNIYQSGSSDTFELDSIQSHLHPTLSHDEPMTWRGDPLDTYSNWTIIIVTNELKTATYHVHKSVVCFGPRLSRYFARIMLGHDSAKKGKSKHRRKHAETIPTTKIELDQKDADRFPILLDYIYAVASTRNVSHDTMLTAASTATGLSLHLASSEDSDPTIPEDDIFTTENAMSLRFLAKKFEVDSFMAAVNKFIQRDLCITTGPFYLTKGWEYRDERIIASAQNLCAENFEQLDVKALIKLPYSLFRVIVKSLESFEGDNKDLSVFLSDIVCRYFEKNDSTLSPPALLELTDSLVMPYMSSEAAIGFTTLVKGLNVDEADGSWSELVSLCHRCARTVVQEYGWSEFSVRGAVDEYLGNSQHGRKQVSRIDSLLFATSFAAALEQAQHDYHGISREQQNLEDTLNALNESLSLMEITNQRKDEVLTKQDQLIGQAKQQIISLKQQMHELREQAQQQKYEQQRENQYKQSQMERGPMDPFHPIPQFVQPLGPPPPPPLPPPIGRATKSRVHAVLSDLEAMNPSEAFSDHEPAHTMTTEEIVRDLISPSHVQSSRAGTRRQNLQTREEMRKKSIL